MGGEEPVIIALTTFPAGLPPRGRGRVTRLRRNSCSSRITPAWAGKSRRHNTKMRAQKDYPRVGGEEVPPLARFFGAAGLPPRGRGRGDGRYCRLAPLGITPAWAGKSQRRVFCGLSWWDYPRVGGEESSTIARNGSAMGLPPRGRGRVDCSFILCPSIRITPAWAGKSLTFISSLSLIADYPRVGGEEPAIVRIFLFHRGLPPRGRGRVPAVSSVSLLGRITPAWAGKSCRGRCLRHWVEDYPRVGGEEDSLKIPSSTHLGLPPRGRGRASLSLIAFFGKRITPAWAGKSIVFVAPRRRAWDYPRVGGEEVSQVQPLSQDDGLPPRGRGRGRSSTSVWRVVGITPAWAGKR